MREHGSGFRLQEHEHGSHRAWLKIVMMLALLCRASATYGAQDAITIGTGSAAPQGVAYVPVYVRDVAGTPLGIDQGAGNRIEALLLKVSHAPALAVASMSFQRGGIASVTPKYERQVQGAGTLGYVAGYSETTHLALSLDAASPGDLIGNLVVTLSPLAVTGSTITLAIDAATATLSNDRGTVGETVASGELVLTNGSILVKTATTTTLASSPNPSVAGQSVTLTSTVASASGSPTGSVAFRDGATLLGSRALSGGHATLTLPLSTPGAHYVTVEYSGDATFAGSSSVAIVHTVTMTPFGAPPGLIATASGTALVGVTWWPVAAAAYYEVRRSVDNGPWVLVGSPVSCALNDASVEAGHTYLYIVLARKNVSGEASNNSNVDAATTVAFTNDPLAVQATTVQATHLLELRTAVNSFRKSVGLLPASFTDASLVAAPIRAVHIQELRNALNPARSMLLLAPVAFTDPDLTPGWMIKAAHIEELRSAVK